MDPMDEVSDATATYSSAISQEPIAKPDPFVFGNREVKLQTPNPVDRKTEWVARTANMQRISGGSGEVGLDFEWGDKNGVKVSGHADGEVYDNKGNYVKVRANRDNNGHGKAGVSAGYKSGRDRDK